MFKLDYLAVIGIIVLFTFALIPGVCADDAYDFTNLDFNMKNESVNGYDNELNDPLYNNSIDEFENNSGEDILNVNHTLRNSVDVNQIADNSLVSQLFYQEQFIEGDEIGPGLPPDTWIENLNVPDISEASTHMVEGEVPVMDWTYGCAATSATMLFGYYDRNGYSNMYAGSINNGLFPLTNTVWGKGECPLTASHQGIDGRTNKGHVDDYWYRANSLNDPYYGQWTEHSPFDCIGDYMGTNQYHNWNNIDGGTWYFSNKYGYPIYDCTDSENCDKPKRDGAHGMKLFAESRGYKVTNNYNQLIYGYNGNTVGFTYSQYMAEIDANHPVIIILEGHAMVGVGYTGTDQIIIHDTWDHSEHTMTWGGSYGNMAHKGVIVFNLKDNVFSIGDTIEVQNTNCPPLNGLLVRDVPAGDEVGGKFDGDQGVIIGGCECAYYKDVYYTWWKIRWNDDGLEGWSAEGYPNGAYYLKKVANSPPATPEVPSGPSSGNTGISYTYSAFTTDPNSDKVTYTFDWGDGEPYTTTSLVNSGTSQSVNHIWETAGTYYVKVKATDDNDVSSGWSCSKTVVISDPVPSNSPPNIPTFTSGPGSGNVNAPYSYSVCTTDPDGDRVKYTFDWGDSEPYTTTSFVNSGTGKSEIHAWNTAGTYYVKVKATDDNDVSSGWSCSKTVVISDPVPSNSPPNIPTFTSGPGSGNVNAPYSYSVCTTDPDGDRVKYTFDWGDSEPYTTTSFVNSGTGKSEIHAWEAAGTYYVKVKATDDNGESSVWSDSKTVVITVPTNSGPQILSFYSSNPDGTYKTGDRIEILATYDKELKKSSNTNVHLNSGADVLLDAVRTHINPNHVKSITNGEIGAHLDNPQSISVSGDYAYVIARDSQTFEVINIANPLNPNLASSNKIDYYSFCWSPQDIYLNGNYAYISEKQAISIWDISNPSAPQLEIKICNGDEEICLDDIRDICVSNNYVYSITSSGTFSIIDVSNPEKPEYVGSISKVEGGVGLGDPISVFTLGNYAYIVSETTHELDIFDISNPENPKFTASAKNGDNNFELLLPRCVVVSGNNAYIATINGLELIDIGNPFNPVHEGHISSEEGGAILNQPKSLFISGNYAYVGTLTGLEIIDVSDSSSPKHAGWIANGEGGAKIFYAEDICIAGNYAYIASSENDAIEIVDISGKSSVISGEYLVQDGEYSSKLNVEWINSHNAEDLLGNVNNSVNLPPVNIGDENEIEINGLPVLSEIIITPSEASVEEGKAINFTAKAYDQKSQEMTNLSFVWTSSNINVGTVDSSTGLFTAEKIGNTIISANSGEISGNATVTVTSAQVIEKDWSAYIDIKSGSFNRSLIIGTSEAASDDFDLNLDVPVPPESPGEKKWSYLSCNDETFDQLQSDYRPKIDLNNSEEEWTLYIRSDETVQINWNLDELADKDIFLTWVNGSVTEVMSDKTGTTLPPGVYSVKISASSRAEKSVNLKAGWNLITIPFEDAEYEVEGNPIAVIYGYNPESRNYYITDLDQLVPGDAYWIAATNDCSVTVSGVPLSAVSKNLTAGWNLIGGPDGTVEFNTIVTVPQNSWAMQSVYGYNTENRNYEQVTQLHEDAGYWGAVIGDCNITISLPERSPSPPV